MIEYATADQVLSWYVQEHSRRTHARGIDLTRPIVDGGEPGCSEDRWAQLTLLVKGVPELAIDVTRVRVFAVAGYTGEPRPHDFPTREAFLEARATWVGPEAWRYTEEQAARLIRVPVSEVRGALQVARRTITGRLQAMIAGGTL